MGISIYYTSCRLLTPEQAETLRAAASAANRGRSWLSSEPVNFFPGLEDGKLVGGSKPNFTPNPDDKKSANTSGLPDGGAREVVEILSQLSRDHAIDWELMHDFGPLGFIRGGVAEPGLINQVDAFAGLGDALTELDGEVFE